MAASVVGEVLHGVWFGLSSSPNIMASVVITAATVVLGRVRDVA
jgi:hypothetical protein